MRLALALLFSTAACASLRARQPAPLRVSASHYESMTGVNMSSSAGPMTCSREAITGSHILRWYCRFGDEPAQYQLSAPIQFVLR
jgi:hypothetical protein